MSNDDRLIRLKRNDEKPQAADWLAKLDRGDLTEDEKEAFAKWLAEDPANKDAIQGIANFWYGLNKPLTELQGVSYDSSRNIPLMQSVTTHFRGFVYASICVVFIVIAAFNVIPEDPGGKRGYYATQIGETRVITLEDGSGIHLNTNSIIEQDFSGGERIVKLLSGEAIFDVAHDKERPFKVHAGDGVIRAIGTRFAVRLRADKVSVTVTEGRVALEKRKRLNKVTNSHRQKAKLAEAKPVMIEPGEAADFDNKAGHIKRAVSDRDVAESLSWAQGQLVFYDRELQFVIDEVARYTNVEITVGDSLLKLEKITGILQLGNIQLMLEGIEGALDVKADWLSEKHVHITAG